MANQSVWHSTCIDESVLEKLLHQLSRAENQLIPATVWDNEGGASFDYRKRNCEVGWISTSHWIAPLIWYYIERANRENFRFDINQFDNECIQYTRYSSGHYYGWHRDDCLGTKLSYPSTGFENKLPDRGNLSNEEVCRKLSFSLLLNDPSEYEGGQFQMISYTNKMYEVPQEKGLLVIFDSTTLHRVRSVKKGTRKSLVGWVMGPRWK